MARQSTQMHHFKDLTMSNAPTPDLDAKPSVKNGGAKDADMKITDKSLALCHAIEAAGASEALTKCSVLASELHAEMQRLTKLSDTMKRFVAENYP